MTPRVGVVAAWFHPDSPAVWSGVPKGVVDELRHLEVYAGFRNATPWPPASRWLHAQRLRRTGTDAAWTLSPEMRALARVTDAVGRATTPRDVDGWVHFVGGYGRSVSGRYVTLFEMSPTQLAWAGRRWRSHLGFPGATDAQVAWAARRQEGVYRRAHACCVASRWAADSLVRDHGIEAAKIHVVGYGCNTETLPSCDRDWSTPRFLFIGRDWERKNGDTVLRAFRQLRREVPDARLDVVGDHPPIHLEGVTPHGPVEVSDPAGRARIESLLQQATCFVLPSRFEPFGIVYVEAAAAGLPSIAGTVGGTADSVGDGGVLVEPDDVEALTAAMRELCHPERARELGEAARSRSIRFSWSATAERVLRSLDVGGPPGVQLAEPL